MIRLGILLCIEELSVNLPPSSSAQPRLLLKRERRPTSYPEEKQPPTSQLKLSYKQPSWIKIVKPWKIWVLSMIMPIKACSCTRTEYGIDPSQITFTTKNPATGSTVFNEWVAADEQLVSTYKLLLNMLAVDEVDGGKLNWMNDYQYLLRVPWAR